MDQRGAQGPREGGEVLHDPIQDCHSVSISQHRAWHRVHFRELWADRDTPILYMQKLGFKEAK